MLSAFQLRASALTSRLMTTTLRSTPWDFTGYHCCRHSEVHQIVQGLEEGMELFIPHRQSAWRRSTRRQGQLCKWLCKVSIEPSKKDSTHYPPKTIQHYLRNSFSSFYGICTSLTAPLPLFLQDLCLIFLYISCAVLSVYRICLYLEQPADVGWPLQGAVWIANWYNHIWSC